MPFEGNVQSDFLKLVDIPVDKRQDLIDYSATDFVTLRNRFIEYIKAVYPLDYNNFAESDLGMVLIELIAYMGSVMSLKADMLANENFLRTAKNRNNVRKLLELIGVSMRGPIGAAANASLTLDSAAASDLSITPDKRVVTITSPEDGGPLNFTIYKITDGLIDPVAADSNITLAIDESEGEDALVWENIALLEGALAVETGTFNATNTIKSVPLTQSPVIQNSVEVYIGTEVDASGAWRLVDNLYFASGSNDKVYQVIYNDDLNATVVFGDGILGRSPAANASYTITYRVGGGTRGNILNELINYPVTLGSNTGIIQNTSQATGGRDAETIEHAKKYAPYTFKRQDRLVTLEDFTTFVTNFVGTAGSTGKATAVTRDAYSSANNIDVFVLQVASTNQLQQATTSFKGELLAAINEKKMLTDEVSIVDGLIRTLDLVVSIRVAKEFRPKEEEIKGKARDAITSFFSVDNFEFGETLVLSDLVRALFEIDEIRFATVDNLTSDVRVEMNEIIQLNNFTINVIYV